MSTDEGADDRKFIDAKVAEMMERFDSVMVFATKHEGGDDGLTRGYNRGRGNFFTRYGQIREWLIYEEEATRVKVRANPENKEPF